MARNQATSIKDSPKTSPLSYHSTHIKRYNWNGRTILPRDTQLPNWRHNDRLDRTYIQNQAYVSGGNARAIKPMGRIKYETRTPSRVAENVLVRTVMYPLMDESLQSVSCLVEQLIKCTSLLYAEIGPRIEAKFFHQNRRGFVKRRHNGEAIGFISSFAECILELRVQ